MYNEIINVDSGAEIDQLEATVRKITGILLDIVRDNQTWWCENLTSLLNQPLTSLKLHLKSLHDITLDDWEFSVETVSTFSILDPIESLVWLAALCRLDRILLGVLPRRFADEIDLQWRVLALHWVR